MISLLPTLQLNSFFMIMWILYFKWDTLRCDILQETDCCFFLELCVKACVWDEALFAQCLPGSWTAVPEVKLAVVSLGLRYTHFYVPIIQTQQKGKMAANLSIFPASHFCLFLSVISEKCFDSLAVWKFILINNCF